MLQPYRNPDIKVKKTIEDTINNMLLFSLIWSLGAILNEDSRKKFSEFIKLMISGKDIIAEFGLETLKPWEAQSFIFRLQDPPTIFDVSWDPEKEVWKSWINTVPQYLIPKEKEFHELIIPTKETICTSYMIQFYVKHNQHILLMGPTGTSKTITVKDALSKFFLNEKYANMQISFSG